MKTHFELLEQQLLALGGNRMVRHPDMDPDHEDAKRMLHQGRWFSPKRGERTLILGWSSHCHQNARVLAYDNPGLEVWTGYALANDGLWRCHSWCVDPRAKKYLVETTVKFLKYWGYRVPKKVWRKQLGGKQGIEQFYFGWQASREVNKLIKAALKGET